ncbi:MAG: hypothetical protein KGO02_21985 [Alphaproteobacteria bacterium]|nr:hypothetical protein [Alphaproteobacteria bacterium]
MTAEIRLSRQLVDQLQADLRRRHPFAHERVGFLSCRTAALPAGGVMIIPVAYHPLEDSEYVESDEAGAMMTETAIGRAMQRAYRDRMSIVHVHEHGHNGRPGFSGIDIREAHEFVPDFFNACPRQPHGLMVLSRDYAAGLVWRHGDAAGQPASVTIVGAPMRFNRIAS